MTRARPRAEPGRGGTRPGARCALLGGALALAAACAPRPPAAVAPPPPTRLFEPYPAEQIATVKDPHDYRGKALCQRCHEPTGALLAPEEALCSRCHHSHRKSSHSVGVTQKAKVDLPLRKDGTVGCITCHDPHQGKDVLRRPFNALCTTCHKGH